MNRKGVCPILTSGRMDNKKWSCVGEECHFWDCLREMCFFRGLTLAMERIANILEESK